MRTSSALLGAVLFAMPSSAVAEEDANGPSFAVSKDVKLQTGDTWEADRYRYRLYGVQSCIRGSIAVNAAGDQHDCGSLSLAQLGALFEAATVTCQPIGRARDDAIFAVCAADLNGATFDVGTAMISSGYAFAATYPDGSAVNMSYVVAELTAKGSLQGLWAYRFLHPVQALISASRSAETETGK